MQISLRQPRRLAKIEQFALLANLEHPNPELRQRRAQLALDLDRFDAARADLEAIPASERSPQSHYLHARACRKLGDLAAAEEALAAAPSSGLPENLRHKLLLERAAILKAQGRLEAAMPLLRGILNEDVKVDAALRRLMTAHFLRGEFALAMAELDRLEAGGLHSTRLSISQTIALAGIGGAETASEVAGFAHFLSRKTLPGMNALNAQVVTELRNHPALRFGNSAQASEGSWRVDELLVRDQPATTNLLSRLIKQVTQYADSLDRPMHAWVNARPEKAQIVAWAIIAPAGGVESWHTHDGGWLSGVYYLAIPEDLPKGKDKAGAIEFGWPDAFLSEEQRTQLPSKLVHPVEGDLLLFPSHIHHRTWPHKSDKDRICIAFDIVAA